MSKTLESAVITQLNATAKRPVLLFEIGLSVPIRFAAYKTDIVFPTGGTTYTAKNIQMSKVFQTLEGQIGRTTVKFDNVIRDMAAYVNAEDFRGKSLVIKRVYLDAMGSASNYYEVFNGFMETPSSLSRYWVTVPATVGKPLNRKSLDFAYQRQCPWVFGDDSTCNTDGNADLTTLTASGTADSGTSAYFIDSALTQVDDYWNNGQITITHSSVDYNRRVKDFDASTDKITFDVELPITVDATTTYTVFKGCDQVRDTCKALNAWGPSADNDLNWGGCEHITAEQDT